MERATENAIRTAYLGYAVATFGAEGMDLVRELPRFAAVTSNRGVIIVAHGNETAKDRLSKALELYANSEGVTVLFEGTVFSPSAYRQVA